MRGKSAATEVERVAARSERNVGRPAASSVAKMMIEKNVFVIVYLYPP